MAWLALSPDSLVPTAQLAEATKVPPHYLAKVLQQLSSARLIEGRRGVRGGYKLSRPASGITLLQVVRAVADVQRISTCPLGLSAHGKNLCPLHKRIDMAAQKIIELYEGVSLADLVNDPNANTPLCEREPTRLTVSAIPARGDA